MNRALATVMIAAALAVFFVVFLGRGDRDTPPSREYSVDRHDASEAAQAVQPTSEPSSHQDDTMGFIECSLYKNTQHDGDLELWLSWQESLGARFEETDRSYYELPDSILRQYSRQGDAAASLARGMNLRARAYGFAKHWPTERYEFMSPTLSVGLDHSLDASLLAEAREELYRAALLGKPDAISDLFWSYVEERNWYERNGTLNDQQNIELLIKAYAIGHVREELFEGNDGGNVQVRLPEDVKEQADRAFRQALSEFSRKQFELIGENLVYSEPPEVDRAWERMRKYFSDCKG